MRPEDQVNVGNGVYSPSDRANKAVKQSLNHMGGRTGEPFYGEGMQEGNTTPEMGTTNTKPISGGTPPTSKKQTTPGADAQNTKVIQKGTI